MHRATAPFLLLLLWLAHPAFGATANEPPCQACTRLADTTARLACFDLWAANKNQERLAPPANPAPAAVAAPAVPAAPTAAASVAQGLQTPPTSAAPGAQDPDCHDPHYTTLSRFWELESATDCGTLRFRGYRPVSVSVVGANRVNQQPTSGNPLNNAANPVAYKSTEMRVQLSVRTKLAKGLLPTSDGRAQDSLWAGYTQQSYWQLFSSGISRPFRNTDHEPELIYVYPTTADLPWGWRLRYSGIGLVHQSNGQSLPLSRSWNRVYLMAGVERGNDWMLTARVWQRLKESAANDDNPHISDTVGRAELTLAWNASRANTLALTTRHSLRANARGSTRVEWLHRLGNDSNLWLHTALFSGYGDSLIDYNRRRTVFSIGLSLLDF